ncbi:MAG: c-type cytochrome [Acidobacteria bacterium]|nr:c-type cytochrome [Acidobacteriota bacterium]
MTESGTPNTSSGWVIVLAVCGVIGVVAVAGTLFLVNQQSAQWAGRPDDVAPAPTAEYGRRLITQTSWLIGPEHPDPAQRFSGNGLNCSSCHLDAGTIPGTLSLTEAFQKYPKFSGRDGKEADLKERIDGCMERSMNGRTLPRDSVEMDAMVAYVRSLSDQFAAMNASRRSVSEPAPFRAPTRAASPEEGAKVFETRCVVCHGRDGAGMLASSDRRRGYLFPPVWGQDSFNNGAGMGRVLTASKFIKARMPLGNATLTDDEAFDVAAYINSQTRAAIDPARLEQDYPDLTKKPVDAPYGPYADSWSITRHKFGPFVDPGR